jgi:hypothetical protein
MPRNCFRFGVVADENTGPGSGTDDEFDRQLRALTEGSAGKAQFKELSAAQRAKAGAKQARQAGKEAARKAAQAKRAARRQRPPGTRDNGGGGRAAGGGGGGGGGSVGRRGLVTGWLVLAVILAVSGGLAWMRIAHPFAGGADDTKVVTNGPVPSATTLSASSRPSPVVSAAPTASPTVLSGPPADPFASSPADQWADGPAGIVIPAAHPVGSYTATQVAGAYQATRKLLIAANLDENTLLGGAPTAFADLLTKQQRTFFVANLDKIGLDKNGDPRSTRLWVTSFAPGTARLIGSVIKVRGTMSARAATVHGSKALDVDVNYRFVYPVEPPGAPADWMRVITEVTGFVQFDDWTSPGQLQPWNQLTTAEDGSRCDVNDGFVHPQYPQSPPDKVRPSGKPVDPYSMASPPQAPGCRSATRT